MPMPIVLRPRTAKNTAVQSLTYPSPSTDTVSMLFLVLCKFAGFLGHRRNYKECELDELAEVAVLGVAEGCDSGCWVGD